MPNLVKTYRSMKGEIISQDDKVTVLRKLTTCNGSPDAKDLHNEFFKSTTYFGDDVVQQKFALYDHLLNPLLNPHSPQDVKSQVLGKATFVKADDLGRWFDYEIQRSSPYHDYVLKMDELGILGASTQAFPNGKSMGDDGGINEWLEGEVTLTLTPADPKTIQQAQEIAKSLKLPVPELVKTEAEAVPEPVTPPPTPADPAPADAVTPPTEEEDEMEKILKQGEEPEAEVPAPKGDITLTQAQFAQLMGAVAESQKSIDLMKTWVWGGIDLHGSPEQGESLWDVLSALQQMVTQQTNETKSMRKGQLSLADYIVKKVGGKLSDIKHQSGAEDEADAIVNTPATPPRKFTPTSGIPEHAPGG